MKTGFPKVLDHLRQADSGLTDGHLLTSFLSTSDGASFAALVRRHGPMVLGVCRRILRDFHDAEDAFQATFLVLASKASSVSRRESVGCWLHSVACNTALAAADANARRRARERLVKDMPHPEVESVPSGPPDWRPQLDRELSRLSERYRAAVVLCDLEGLPQKEAARILGVAPGTVSSRLTRARALLAKRLAARGLGQMGAALGASVAADAASARVPAALADSTVRVAALVATGQLAAAAGPAVVLMKGVMKVMLMKKLKMTVGAAMITATLVAVGIACRPLGEARAQDSVPARNDATPATARPGGNPLSELEALRRENEDLRAAIRVLLKEFRTPEKDQQYSRSNSEGWGKSAGNSLPTGNTPGAANAANHQNFLQRSSAEPPGLTPLSGAGPVPADSSKSQGQSNRSKSSSSLTPAGGGSAHGREMEAALRELREASDQAGRLRAADALEKAMKKLRDDLNRGTGELRRN